MTACSLATLGMRTLLPELSFHNHSSKNWAYQYFLTNNFQDYSEDEVATPKRAYMPFLLLIHAHSHHYQCASHREKRGREPT